ncbi:MAG: lantibiotic dehydratase, partial [Chryseotalea sp.]
MNSEFFVLRAPLFPFENVYLDKDEFLKILDLPVFKESILVSSPDLYQKLIEFNSGIIIDESDKKKVYQSLYRFFLRMSARCTPFGLFSG